jgi:hypothetical protein
MCVLLCPFLMVDGWLTVACRGTTTLIRLPEGHSIKNTVDPYILHVDIHVHSDLSYDFNTNIDVCNLGMSNGALISLRYSFERFAFRKSSDFEGCFCTEQFSPISITRYLSTVKREARILRRTRYCIPGCVSPISRQVALAFTPHLLLT